MRVGVLRGCVAFGLLGLTGCPNVGALLRQYGFTEVRPPSNLLAPGTVVWVQKHRPFTAGIICTQDESLGADFEPMQAPTSTREMKAASNGTFAVGVEFLEMIHGDLRFSDVESITVQVKNPVVHTISDTDILNHVGKRSVACEQAIAARRNGKYTVSIIASALRADVIYSVAFKTDNKLEASAKIATLENLAVKLGLEHGRVRGNTIQGDNLYWGVTDDAFLARLGERLSAGDEGPGQRELPVDEITEVDTQPDSGHILR